MVNKTSSYVWLDKTFSFGSSRCKYLESFLSAMGFFGILKKELAGEVEFSFSSSAESVESVELAVDSEVDLESYIDRDPLRLLRCLFTTFAK